MFLPFTFYIFFSYSLDEERQACFARIEIQRANEYRNRLTRFYQDYAISDELFIFTMDNLKIKALADGSLTTGEQIIEQMKMMDDESPWPNLTDKDFCTLWCRIITLNVDRWRFQLRDYPKPCWDVTDLFLWGKLVIAEQVADEKGKEFLSLLLISVVVFFFLFVFYFYFVRRDILVSVKEMCLYVYCKCQLNKLYGFLYTCNHVGRPSIAHFLMQV
ncbi:unnamed protein product [Trichobilharzia regenti]|nr:unnamed protein product [Trichobilharzia regenti]